MTLGCESKGSRIEFCEVIEQAITASIKPGHGKQYRVFARLQHGHPDRLRTCDWNMELKEWQGRKMKADIALSFLFTGK
jgi:hypothetical protein